jgi:hypothetical protein
VLVRPDIKVGVVVLGPVLVLMVFQTLVAVLVAVALNLMKPDFQQLLTYLQRAVVAAVALDGPLLVGRFRVLAAEAVPPTDLLLVNLLLRVARDVLLGQLRLDLPRL